MKDVYIVLTHRDISTRNQVNPMVWITLSCANIALGSRYWSHAPVVTSETGVSGRLKVPRQVA
ncbi:MAG: hypothetical protein K5905_21005 [Roseibium sp.]|nr:hypothetical protein [Roseibium sp.]